VGSYTHGVSVVRINFLPEFYLGDDVVLLTLDGSGVDKMKAAVAEAQNNRSSRLLVDGVIQEFYIEPGAATAELTPARVVWRLDADKAAEIADNLAALSIPRDGGTTAGHFYVDIRSPAPTLVISRDEYTDVIYSWVSPDY
jgi:hypothetical protein